MSPDHVWYVCAMFIPSSSFLNGEQSEKNHTFFNFELNELFVFSITSTQKITPLNCTLVAIVTDICLLEFTLIVFDQKQNVQRIQFHWQKKIQLGYKWF